MYCFLGIRITFYSNPTAMIEESMEIMDRIAPSALSRSERCDFAGQLSAEDAGTTRVATSATFGISINEVQWFNFDWPLAIPLVLPKTPFLP
jgi:hypothetical protein